MKQINEIKIERKPTKNHQNPCPYCMKEIKKGEIEIAIVSGVFRNSWNYARYHKKCFIEGINKMIMRGENI
jgi:hypothetical protein